MAGEKLLAFSVLVMVFLPGCILDFGNSGAVSVKIISVGEKDMVWHFGERVTLNVTVKSSTLLDNVTITIAGLKNKLNQMKLYKSTVIELAKGTDIISFSYSVPTCSPCNRLDPGVYYVNATISRNGEVLAEGSGTVKLVK